MHVSCENIRSNIIDNFRINTHENYESYTSNTETKLQKLYHSQYVRCLQGAVIDWSIYGGLRLQDTSAHLERFIYSFIYSLVNISLELVGGCHIYDEDAENQVLRKLSVGHIKILFR